MNITSEFKRFITIFTVVKLKNKYHNLQKKRNTFPLLFFIFLFYKRKNQDTELILISFDVFLNHEHYIRI